MTNTNTLLPASVISFTFALSFSRFQPKNCFKKGEKVLLLWLSSDEPPKFKSRMIQYFTQYLLSAARHYSRWLEDISENTNNNKISALMEPILYGGKMENE